MLHISPLQFGRDSSPQSFHPLEPYNPATNTESPTQALALRLEADRPRHLRYLRSRLPTAEDAEDALQDATLKFLQNASALAAAQNPEAWLGVSLQRIVVDRYRRAATRKRMAAALAAEPRKAPDEDPDETRTPIECLKRELDGLKPEYATILRQVYLDEIPLAQVAERGALTANNAAVRLHRARAALRKVMRDRCPQCPIADCWGRQRLAAVATDDVPGACRSGLRLATAA